MRVPRPLLRRLLTIVFAALLGMAGASPATELYQAALVKLKAEYYGWSVADLSSLNAKYTAMLNVRCAQAAQSCDYATGRAVLTDLLREFGDLHTNIRDPEAAERLREVMEDLAVARTGARVVRVEGGLLVVSVMPGSPAERDGLGLYDLLTQVNGQDAGKRGGKDAAIGPNEFIRLERAGQPITVMRLRAGENAATLQLHTENLKARDVPVLSWAGADGKTAVITYPSFLAADNSALFLERVQEARGQGARQLVVDLRFNTGGSLLDCVAASSIFGPVEYRTQYRSGNRYSYLGQNGHPAGVIRQGAASRVWDGPAAILIGPNTASCAEVFTFYAQQAGVIAVGEPTKGVANSGVIFEAMPDGGTLAVTILRAYTAQNQPLPRRIRPDILAPTSITALTGQGVDTTLQAALNALAGR